MGASKTVNHMGREVLSGVASYLFMHQRCLQHQQTWKSREGGTNLWRMCGAQRTTVHILSGCKTARKTEVAPRRGFNDSCRHLGTAKTKETATQNETNHWALLPPERKEQQPEVKSEAELNLSLSTSRVWNEGKPWQERPVPRGNPVHSTKTRHSLVVPWGKESALGRAICPMGGELWRSCWTAGAG